MTHLEALKKAESSLRAAVDDLQCEIAQIEAGEQTSADANILFGANVHARDGVESLRFARESRR